VGRWVSRWDGRRRGRGSYGFGVDCFTGGSVSIDILDDGEDSISLIILSMRVLPGSTAHKLRRCLHESQIVEMVETATTNDTDEDAGFADVLWMSHDGSWQRGPGEDRYASRLFNQTQTRTWARTARKKVIKI
jgi:hypothetical protein